MFDSLQYLVLLLISVAAFAGAVWALIDAARYPEGQFQAAGKRTKTFWLVVLGVATLIAFLSLPAPLGAGGGVIGFLGIAAIVAVIIYAVDVRPALGPRRPGSSGGSRGSSRGGW